MPKNRYVVAYAKIVVEKDEGIVLQGIYFGGLAPTSEAAEALARDCVNKVRGATTIIPRIERLDEDNLIIDALYNAQERFQAIVSTMIEANAIYAKRK